MDDFMIDLNRYLESKFVNRNTHEFLIVSAAMLISAIIAVLICVGLLLLGIKTL